MKMIHQMSLKGPWDYQWVSPQVDEEILGCPLKGSLKIPILWNECFGERVGEVLWKRRFQKPTNLEPSERVMIAATQLAGISNVVVNDTALPLGDQPEVGFRFDITDLLASTNMLELEMTCDTPGESSKRGMTEPAIIEIWSLD